MIRVMKSIQLLIQSNLCITVALSRPARTRGAPRERSRLAALSTDLVRLVARSPPEMTVNEIRVIRKADLPK